MEGSLDRKKKSKAKPLAVSINKLYPRKLLKKLAYRQVF